MLNIGGDLFSRIGLAPQELPVGIVAAAAGDVLVLALLVKGPVR